MRRKLKSLFASLIAVFLMATLIIPLAACVGGQEGNVAVSIVSMGNRGLKGVKVTATSGDKTTTGTTNDKGEARLNIDTSLKYNVELSNLPKGYYIDSEIKYSISANSDENVKFYVPSKVIEGESVDPKYVYKTGDVMYDFSFTTTKGAEVSLAQELATKKAVIINFWGSGCSNCAMEFPEIEAAYQNHKDDLSVMALVPPNCYGDKTNQALENALSNWGVKLSFHYGLDSPNIFPNFYAPAQSGEYAVPLSIFVDRYGVVCEIIVGRPPDPAIWNEEISKYVADDYVPDINDGQTSDEIQNLEPDLPADFNAQMSDPDEISRAINKTGTDIMFTSDPSEYAWPWAVSPEGDSIVPLGSNHTLTVSIIYADINMTTDQALLIDYKVSSYEYYNQFAIIVDGKNDLGRTTLTDSGNKGWQTALAYIPLTAGNHSIAFVYQKGSPNNIFEDTVYVKNLRLVSATSEEIPSTDMSYYAARDYNPRQSSYNTYEQVYLDEKDGYYHIKGRNNGGKDPYLLCDMSHAIPYTRSTSFYAQFISENNCTYGGKNYYNQLLSYARISSNSKIDGAVPVTQELKDILVALCKHDAGEDAYAENPDMWLEFCIFYLHYGSGKAMEDPVIGLAYFSAEEATLTEAYDTERAKELLNAIDEAVMNGDDAAIKTAKDNHKAYMETFNHTEFDTVIVPRGKVFKFTAPEDGVYHFYSVGGENDTSYVCEGEIYGSDLKLQTSLAQPIYTFDNDAFLRKGSLDQFHLYHYLKQGEFCYVNIRFFNSDKLGTMYFAVNKIGDEYKNLSTVASGVLLSHTEIENMGQLYRPLYTEVELKADNYYYDKSFGNRIFVDFTELTRFSATHSLEDIIEAEAAGTPIQTAAIIDGELGTIDVNFNFEDVTVRLGKEGDPDYEVINGKDYTQEMRDYLAQSKLVGTDSVEYGLVEANKELRNILLLFTAKYSEVTVEEDWLIFCYYYECFGANY